MRTVGHPGPRGPHDHRHAAARRAEIGAQHEHRAPTSQRVRQFPAGASLRAAAALLWCVKAQFPIGQQPSRHSSALLEIPGQARTGRRGLLSEAVPRGHSLPQPAGGVGTGHGSGRFQSRHRPAATRHTECERVQQHFLPALPVARTAAADGAVTPSVGLGAGLLHTDDDFCLSRTASGQDGSTGGGHRLQCRPVEPCAW